MTFEEYRVSARREWLAELMTSPEWQEVMGILEQAGPAHIAVSPAVTPHGAHIELGKRIGFSLYSDMLKTLALKPREETADIESHYAT